jgi:transcriptional regulator with XRE-family HTH domain
MASSLSFAPVKEKARAKGIRSARQLALRSGLDPRTVGKYWRDKPGEIQQIDVDVLLTLVAFFGCPPGDLMVVITEP